MLLRRGKERMVDNNAEARSVLPQLGEYSLTFCKEDKTIIFPFEIFLKISFPCIFSHPYFIILTTRIENILAIVILLNLYR